MSKENESQNKRHTSKLGRNLTAAALFSLSSIVACGPEFNDGTITEKNYYKSYSRRHCQPLMVGKVMICIWKTQEVPERFAVEIEHCFPKDPSPPECLNKEVTVDQQAFQDLKIGQYVSFGR